MGPAREISGGSAANTLAGLASVDAMQRDLMHSYAASYGQTLSKLRLPAALPFSADTVLLLASGVAGVTITDTEGNVVAWSSAGGIGFKGLVDGHRIGLGLGNKKGPRGGLGKRPSEG